MDFIKHSCDFQDFTHISSDLLNERITLSFGYDLRITLRQNTYRTSFSIDNKKIILDSEEFDRFGLFFTKSDLNDKYIIIVKSTTINHASAIIALVENKYSNSFDKFFASRKLKYQNHDSFMELNTAYELSKDKNDVFNSLELFEIVNDIIYREKLINNEFVERKLKEIEVRRSSNNNELINW